MNTEEAQRTVTPKRSVIKQKIQCSNQREVCDRKTVGANNNPVQMNVDIVPSALPVALVNFSDSDIDHKVRNYLFLFSNSA